MRTVLLALASLGFFSAARASVPHAWHDPEGLRLALPSGTRVTLLDAHEKVVWTGTARTELLIIAGEHVDPMLRIIRLNDAEPRSLQELFPDVEVTSLLPSSVALGLPLQVLAVTRSRAGDSDEFVSGVRGYVQLSCDGLPLWTAQLLTDEAGVAQATEPVPANVTVSSPAKACELQLTLGGATVDTRVKLVSGSRVLLSSDRPIYRPGDTLYARALTLDRATSRPMAGVPVTLSLVDANGSKVSQATTTSSAFGIASGALEVPSGLRGATFQMVAQTPDEKVTRQLALGQFVKAGLEVTLTAPEMLWIGRPWRASVQITRLDGGPAAGADVDLQLGTWRRRARADANGQLSLELPGQENDVTLVVRAEAAGGRMGRAERGLRVARDQAQLYVVPESGQLAAGLATQAWAVLLDGAGDPLPDADVSGAGGSCRTNDSGICQLTLRPTGNTLKVVASWEAGAQEAGTQETGEQGATKRPTASSTFRTLDVTHEAALLSLDSAILSPGQPLVGLYRRSGSSGGTSSSGGGAEGQVVRLELVAEGQVLGATTARLVAGEARLRLAVPPDAKGTLIARAFHLDARGHVEAGDARLVLITPPADLTVVATADQPVYAPRQTASVSFAVTDGNGQPLVAAISATAVDAGLRMLGLEQPGIERAVARIGPEWATRDVPAPPWAQTALLAAGDRLRLEVLASAVSVTLALPGPSETGRERLTLAASAFEPALTARAKTIGKALTDYYKSHSAARGKPMITETLLAEGAFAAASLSDPWSRPIRAEWRPDKSCCNHSFKLRSAGADGRFDTADDVLAVGFFRGWSECRRSCPMGVTMAGMGAGGGAHSVAYGRGASNARGPLSDPPMREWFPDTLAVLPEQVTGADGRTTWSLPLADSLTRWLLQVRAVSADGGLGETELELPVQQAVSTDVALEPELVLGDQITLPLEVRNGTGEPADFDVRVEVVGAARLADAPPASITVAAGTSLVLPLRFQATRVGEATVTISAIGPAGGDRVRRTFMVVSGGVPTQRASAGSVAAGRTVNASVQAPSGGIPGTERVRLRLYGGALGTVVEGLESLLASPSGCFEQTSATTYPNALVLDYLERADLKRPEVALRARELLKTGWERLRSYEVPAGGFSWFGTAPANQVLTAFGLMEFAVMGRHVPIDKALVARTRSWLLAQRKASGQWAPDAEYLHAESWKDLQSGALPVTAYITWALIRSGEPLESLEPSLRYLQEHATEAGDPYTRAVVALALAAARNTEAEGATQRLASGLTRVAGNTPLAWLPSDAPTVTHAHGNTAGLETTGLAALALLSAPGFGSDAQAAVEWLLSQRHAGAGWGSTQATVLALEALLERERQRAMRPEGLVTVTGRPADERFDATNADVVRELVLPAGPTPSVELRFDGEGEVRYQLGAEVDLPAAAASHAKAPLHAALTLPTSAAVGEALHGVVTIRAIETVVMPLVTLELPAATELDLVALRQVAGLDRIEQVGRRLELYARRFEAGSVLDVPLVLTPRRAGTLHGGALLALPFYEPERRHAEAGATLTVAP